MYIITTILLITILISTIQSARPATKLTFTPDDKYLFPRSEVEIKCEILNPNERTEPPQLWHVDLKTGKRTSISRSLLISAPADAPEIFKNNKNQRYHYERKNTIRIRNLQPEDSAKYECDCPDCMDTVQSQSRTLSIMKINPPTWTINSSWPLHEEIKVDIKCQADDFFPYVGHKILRNQIDITNEGKSSLPSNTGYPQKFVWEATIKPGADWHNTSIHCIVTQGNSDQNTSKLIEVLFAPRFGKCDETQLVDSKKNLSSIECSYSGNPQPALLWLRQSDKKLLSSDMGITIEVRNESYGKYKSILTFNRDKLLSMPLETKVIGQGNKTEENFYQQLLSGGFIAQLQAHGNDKDKRVITIARDANQIRSLSSNGSTIFSYSSMLLSLLLILYIHQR